ILTRAFLVLLLAAGELPLYLHRLFPLLLPPWSIRTVITETQKAHKRKNPQRRAVDFLFRQQLFFLFQQIRMSVSLLCFSFLHSFSQGPFKGGFAYTKRGADIFRVAPVIKRNDTVKFFQM